MNMWRGGTPKELTKSLLPQIKSPKAFAVPAPQNEEQYVEKLHTHIQMLNTQIQDT